MSEVDNLSVNTIRLLAMDTVHQANSGHSGAPLGLAPAAHVLWSKYLKFEPKWLNRDRFVLSCGHASALLYSLLHIHTRVLTIDDLKQFRQFGSKTSGHPEHHLVPEIEVTTGPLGQGISNSVGLAVASSHVASRFNKSDLELFNNRVFVFSSDGDMMEGVQYEAVSFAGHQKLNNLIVFWDDNKVTIDGHTDIAFTEDVPARFRAAGWHTIDVANADTDLDRISSAIEEALSVNDKPVLIDLHTTIGYGSALADTPKVHGTPLNKEQLAQIKEKFGFDSQKSFYVPEQVYKLYDDVRSKTHSEVETWESKFKAYEQKYPTEFAELQQLLKFDFSVESMKKFMPQANDKNIATRVSSGLALNALAANMAGLLGGTADLTPSNNTELKGQTSFQPGNHSGRYIEFGIREHAMQAIANGIVYYGFPGLIPFTATFFVFIQYLLPALRVASIEHLRELLIMTHDSIGVGEDGATHEPVENLAIIRSLPNCYMMRPSDQLETSACYTAAMTGKSQPTVLALSRQNAPPIEGSSFDGVLRGGYVVKSAESPKIIFIGTGTEVNLCVQAASKLGIKSRIVSMPCMELFEEQDEEYKRSVLPSGIPIVSVEAGSSFGWAKYSHAHIGIDTFGMSSPADKIFDYFGLTPEKVAIKAKQVVDFYSTHPVPDLLARPF